MGDELEEVECNMCGYVMSYNEQQGIYECSNSDCTRCEDDTLEKQEIIDNINIGESIYISSRSS